MPKHPLKPAEIRPPFIKPDADFDVWIGGFGSGRNDRITVIKTAVVTRDDPWEKVDHGRILLAGSVRPDLMRLLERHGREQINNATATAGTPNGLFGGSSFDRLCYYLSPPAKPNNPKPSPNRPFLQTRTEPPATRILIKSAPNTSPAGRLSLH